MSTAKSVKLGLNAPNVEGKVGELYATPTGLKVGAKGHVFHPLGVNRLPKRERRAVRKALHANGRIDLILASIAN
jgi:hypothetical protein